MVKNGTCTNGNLQKEFTISGDVAKELNEKDVTIKRNQLVVVSTDCINHSSAALIDFLLVS